MSNIMNRTPPGEHVKVSTEESLGARARWKEPNADGHTGSVGPGLAPMGPGSA